MNRYAAWLTLWACALALTLVGCGGGSVGSQSLVRTLNAYVPAPTASAALSITAGNTSLTGGGILTFGAFANNGGFTSVPDGAFNPIATGSGLSGSLQFPTPPTLSSAIYTLVAAGEAGQTGARAPQFLLTSNYTQGVLIIPQNNTAVRVVNVSANGNPIGLYGTASGVPSAVLAPSLASVQYGFSETANPYVAVPTSQLTNLALVDSTSTTSALTLSGTSNLNSFTLMTGEAYTLYVYGQPGNADEPLGATWVLDWPIL